MKVERKIIFETRVGSHLYGTNRPESDEDFMGIFLPSTEDVLGLQNPPTEWSKNEKLSTGERNEAGDTDRKYYSLRQFFNLLSEGQPGQLEMLFSPRAMWEFPRRAFQGGWSKILQNREIFVSKGSIMPFIGFAKAQAYKATIKGDNLNLLRDMILHLSRHSPYDTLGQALLNGAVTALMYDNTRGSVKLKYVQSEGGIPSVEVAGREYEFTQQIRYVLQKLKKVEAKYGTRSEAAAEVGFDYKSLMHAYRLLFEAKILLTEGELRFPLPVDTVTLLKKIRAGEYQADFFDEIENMLTDLRGLQEKSTLPYSVDRAKVNELCQEMMYEHLFSGETK